MEARHSNLREILSGRVQFEIPIYQRMYSWEQVHCEQLFDDVLKTGESNGKYNHFIGSIVYVESGDSEVSSRYSPKLIIDGQQRLTTIMLLLQAISEELKDIEDGRNSDLKAKYVNFKSSMIKSDYLVNSDENIASDNYFKLILSKNDKETLKSIIATGEVDPNGDYSHGVFTNYSRLKRLVFKNHTKLDILIRGIENLIIVAIELKRGKDNPQLVFESMNSTGKGLDESDKIRNFILMDLEIDVQKNLYSEYWRPMEERFGEARYKKHFDSFMKYYLTMKREKIVQKKEIYDEFKIYSQSMNKEDIVQEINKFSDYYCKIVFAEDEDEDLRKSFFLIITLLKADEVTCPFLLLVYNDYKNGLLQREEFLQILTYCESYLFRLIVEHRSKGTVRRNAFLHLTTEMLRQENKQNYLNSVKSQFRWLNGNQSFTNDTSFVESIKSKSLYENRYQLYWLVKMEDYGGNDYEHVNNRRLENVMPVELTDDWKNELGSDAEIDHFNFCHNLGNLTFVEYGDEYSSYPFSRKQNLEQYGLSISPLYLNQSFSGVEKWNKEAIIARAEKLAEAALAIWPYPNKSEE